MELAESLDTLGLEDSRQESNMCSITTSNQSNSPLLKLPAELRNSIYEAMFCDYIRVHARNEVTWNKAEQAKLNLLLTCRQIRHEATPVLFRASTFDFEYLWDMVHLSTRASTLMQQITSIRITDGTASGLSSPASSGAYWLRKLLALKEVRVQGACVSEDKKEMLSTLAASLDGQDVRFVYEDADPVPCQDQDTKTGSLKGKRQMGTVSDIGAW